jgi:ATP-dependent protease ClpP protease subunit
MSQFNYITNYIKGKKSAKMYIRKPITGPMEGGVNGEDFAREMEYLANEGVDEVTIDINSVGGSIKEGFTIFAAIKDAPFKTTTRVIGIAASMAGIISQAGDKRVILDYGIFHAHGPQVPEGKKVGSDVLNIMLSSLKTMIGARANMSEDKVSEILGKETVLTALEAKDLGLFDEIEQTTGIKPVFVLENGIEELFNLTNKYINKTEQMENLKKFLALENATELEIINSLKEKQAETEADKAKIDELTASLEAKETENEAKVTELNATILELKNEAANELISSCIAKGQLSEESRKSWTDLAVNDFAGTKELLSGLIKPSKASILKNEIGGKKEDKEDRKGWDFQKYSQDDPKGLEALKASDPEAFDALFNAYVDGK